MLGKQKGGATSPPDDCGPAHLGQEAGTAGAVSGRPPDKDSIAHRRSPCQAPRLGNLGELAAEALKRAWAAGLLAECCGLAGDPLGRADWLRRRALHLAIYYSATHPQEVPA